MDLPLASKAPGPKFDPRYINNQQSRREGWGRAVQREGEDFDRDGNVSKFFLIEN